MPDLNTDNSHAALKADTEKLLKQNKLILKNLDRNKRRIDSSLLVLGGGLVAAMLLILSFETKSISDERFNRLTDYAFELIALSVAGGTGFAAIKRDHRPDNDGEDEEPTDE